MRLITDFGAADDVQLTGSAGTVARDLMALRGVAGRHFSFKADGVLLEDKHTIPASTAVLELVEVSAAPPAAPTPSVKAAAPAQVEVVQE